MADGSPPPEVDLYESPNPMLHDEDCPKHTDAEAVCTRLAGCGPPVVGSIPIITAPQGYLYRDHVTPIPKGGK